MTPHDTSPRPWVIYGAGEYSLTVADLLAGLGYPVLGFIDDFGQPLSKEMSILGTFAQVATKFEAVRPAIALGIGYRDLSARWAAWNRARALGWPTPPVVHARAYVARNALLGDGCLVMAGAIVDRQVHVGEAVTLWPGACINHDTVVGNNCFISPNATICGHVRVGPHSFIGAGAIIADHCEVPASSFLKMGARFSAKSVCTP